MYNIFKPRNTDRLTREKYKLNPESQENNNYQTFEKKPC